MSRQENNNILFNPLEFGVILVFVHVFDFVNKYIYILCV